MTPAFASQFDTSAAAAALVSWYRTNRKPLPWRTKFAQTADPYVIWISEIMLQQTVIKAVEPVYQRFLEAFPTVHDLAEASEADVRTAVRGLGYYRRFRMMHQAAQILAQRAPAWPSTFAEWKELPGIGDYTAAAIASIAFGDPVAVLDGNVERVIARLIDWRAPVGQTVANKRQFRALAQCLIEREAPGDSNQGLMELGQTLCTPTNPQCPACPLAFGCQAKAKRSTHLAPAPKVRTPPQPVRLELHLVRDQRGRIGLFERPTTARFLKGALGFPTAVIATNGSKTHDGGNLSFPRTGDAIGEVKHSITHHQITAAVVCSKKSTWPQTDAWRWIEPNVLEEHLIANLDRKAWTLLRKKL